MPTVRAEQSSTHHPTRPETGSVQPSTAALSPYLGLTLARQAAMAVHKVVDALDEVAVHEPSRLPGWSRGHVVSHLARNADALVNLLTWARTGIEHPLYTSRADRDADIEEGAHRLVQVMREDLDAAEQRFWVAAGALNDHDWRAVVTGRQGRVMPAVQIPWMRMTELLVHLIDLDVGVDFDRILEMAGDQTVDVLNIMIDPLRGRDDVPPLRLVIDLPSGAQCTWLIGAGTPHEVSGPAAIVLGWLTGRGGSGGLTGTPPELPDWL